MNQYQANHNPSPRPAAANGFYGILRVLALLAVVFLVMWLWP